MNPRILVLGADGQLGREIQRSSKNIDFEFIFANRQYLDISNYSNLLSCIEGLKPDWIINCAAFTNVDLAEVEKDVCWGANAQGPRNIAMICSSKKIRLIHMSTDSVFASEKYLFNKISDITNPINEYGRSKVAGETAIIENLNDDYWIIRTAWLYGKGGRNFVTAILVKLQMNRPFHVVDDQFGQPTWTQNVVQAIFGILESVTNPGILHIVTPGVTSRAEWARSIAKISNSDTSLILPINTIKNESIAMRPKYSLIEPSKIEGTRNDWLNPPEVSLSNFFTS
jgi:dTDP-4-dehydrorhamnose reductase